MSFGRAQVRIDIFCNIFCIRKKDRSKDRAIDKWANALVPPTPVNGLGHRSRRMHLHLHLHTHVLHSDPWYQG